MRAVYVNLLLPTRGVIEGQQITPRFEHMNIIWFNRESTQEMRMRGSHIDT